MMNGAELFTEFRRQRSEKAFADLVGRYGDLVFSVAMRRLSNAALAEEAAQSVFVRLAQSAATFGSEAELIGWLHRTSIHVAVDLWRSETRRRAREEKAASMQGTESNEHASPLAAAVDEALDELSEGDRQTLLLRFFDGCKMRELAEKFGITEDAAKMRVSRSLDRLRERLASKGVQTTSALLAAFLAEQAVTALPAAIAQSILHSGASLTAGTSLLIQLASLFKWKYAAILAGAALVAIIVIKSNSSPVTPAGAQAETKSTPAAPANSVGPAEQALDPATIAANPIQLLENVARARKRIKSGKIAFEHVSELNENSVHGRAETNSVRGEIIFDGPRRRIEQIGYEYAYKAPGEAGEKQAQLIKDKKMSRADAMGAGLLEEFEAHYVSAYDETAILEYYQHGDRYGSAVIRDPSHGSSLVGHFDPRCLGLRSFATGTLESALSLTCGDEVALVGEESVEGIPAWHVRVRCRNTDRNYWVSVAQPDRLLKHAELGDVYASYYSSSRPRDPLPTKVIIQTRHGIQKLDRTAGEYNMSIDPATFTLVGLGIPRGTPVVDERASRSLGYWTGAGFSEEFLPKEEREPTNPGADSPTILEQRTVLESEPETLAGLDAALWIIFNTPDGPAVEKSANAILEHHIQRTNLLALASRLERLRPNCAKQLLTQLLAKNPDPEIRGTACFSLAQTFFDEAKFGADPKATAEAKSYYQRFIRDFFSAGKTAFDKKHKSAKAIEEIERGFLGHDAPAVTATSTAGETLKIGGTQERATLLLFRGLSSGYEAEEYRKIHDKLADRDVSFVSVLSSSGSKNEKIDDYVEASVRDWSIVTNGVALKEAFYVHSWPSIVLIDKNGKIRARGLRGESLEKAIIAATDR
ncbi:MAG TPA: sigma-70 family RNA polymerase sigma factor [Verrucomicrobiae bacterium]|nr:sigma-70 family RNA polymerase sigma factor [Verrucomicrobiae bacterium]